MRMAKVHDIGAVIRELRKERGLTQQALADRIGVSYQMVQKYENGKCRIYVNRLHAIAKILGVHISELIGKDAATKTIKPQNTEDEVTLLMLFRKLRTRRIRNSVLDMIQDIVRAAESR